MAQLKYFISLKRKTKRNNSFDGRMDYQIYKILVWNKLPVAMKKEPAIINQNILLLTLSTFVAQHY